MVVNRAVLVSVHGYDVTILIDLCKAIIRAEADGALLKQPEHRQTSSHLLSMRLLKLALNNLFMRYPAMMRLAKKLLLLSNFMSAKKRNFRGNFQTSFIENGIGYISYLNQSETSLGSLST